jgi:hypothetical protein
MGFSPRWARRRIWSGWGGPRWGRCSGAASATVSGCSTRLGQSFAMMPWRFPANPCSRNSRPLPQGSRYAAFRRQREGVAQHLAQARSESSARQFRARAAFPEVPRPRLDALPSTLTWRRAAPSGVARFEILYEDGADLMAQLAEFLHAAGANREEFFEGTEPEP